MDTVDTARRLIAFASEAMPDEIEVKDFPVTNDDEEMWLREFGVHEPLPASGADYDRRTALCARQDRLGSRPIRHPSS